MKAEPQHCASLCEAMWTSRENSNFCDIIIHTTTSTLYAHAIVLASASPELYLLIRPCSESYKKGIKYQLDLREIGCDHDIMLNLLSVCYTGILGYTVDSSIQSMYTVAQYLGLNKVAMMCLKYMQRMSSANNSSGITVPSTSATAKVAHASKSSASSPLKSGLTVVTISKSPTVKRSSENVESNTSTVTSGVSAVTSTASKETTPATTMVPIEDIKTEQADFDMDCNDENMSDTDSCISNSSTPIDTQSATNSAIDTNNTQVHVPVHVVRNTQNPQPFQSQPTAVSLSPQQKDQSSSSHSSVPAITNNTINQVDEDMIKTEKVPLSDEALSLDTHLDSDKDTGDVTPLAFQMNFPKPKAMAASAAVMALPPEPPIVVKRKPGRPRKDRDVNAGIPGLTTMTFAEMKEPALKGIPSTIKPKKETAKQRKKREELERRTSTENMDLTVHPSNTATDIPLGKNTPATKQHSTRHQCMTTEEKNATGKSPCLDDKYTKTTPVKRCSVVLRDIKSTMKDQTSMVIANNTTAQSSDRDQTHFSFKEMVDEFNNTVDITNETEHTYSDTVNDSSSLSLTTPMAMNRNSLALNNDRHQARFNLNDTTSNFIEATNTNIDTAKHINDTVQTIIDTLSVGDDSDNADDAMNDDYVEETEEVDNGPSICDTTHDIIEEKGDDENEDQDDYEDAEEVDEDKPSTRETTHDMIEENGRDANEVRDDYGQAEEVDDDRSVTCEIITETNGCPYIRDTTTHDITEENGDEVNDGPSMSDITRKIAEENKDEEQTGGKKEEVNIFHNYGEQTEEVDYDVPSTCDTTTRDIAEEKGKEETGGSKVDAEAAADYGVETDVDDDDNAIESLHDDVADVETVGKKEVNNDCDQYDMLNTTTKKLITTIEKNSEESELATSSDKVTTYLQQYLPEIKCLVCNKTFKEKQAYSDHIRTVHNGKRIKCSYCPKLFENRAQLKRHAPQHTGEYDFYCPKCGRGLSDRFVYKRHVTKCKAKPGSRRPIKHGTMRSDDNITEDATVMNKDSDEAENEIGPDANINKLFPCSYCAKAFPDQSDLNLHIQQHTGFVKYSCSKCNRGFPRQYSLTRHIGRCKVSGDSPSKTEKQLERCKVDPARPTDMSQYLEKLNALANIIKCFECLEMFESVDALQGHLDTKHDGLRYRCEYCEEEFVHVVARNEHVQEHTGVTRNVCPLCKKGFRYSLLRNRHFMTCKLIPSELKLPPQGRETDRSKQVYQCPECSKSFRCEANLKYHMQQHTGNYEYHCPRCNRGLTNKHVYKRHLERCKANLNETKYIEELRCFECLMVLANENDYKDHMTAKHAGVQYSCAQCDAAFPYMQALHEHNQEHTGFTQHVCRLCRKGFKKANNLSKHKRCCRLRKPQNQVPEKEIEYPDNNQVAIETTIKTENVDASESLNKTAMARDTKAKRFICPECGTTFKEKAVLQRHIAIKHQGYRYLCQICGQDFGSHVTFNAHVRRHKGQYTHRCQLCDKVFYRGSSYRMHLIRCQAKMAAVKAGDGGATDENGKPIVIERKHACDACPKRFLTKVDLYCHVRSVHKATKHVCETCGKEYTSKRSLDCHMQKHTGNFTFRCDICGLGVAKASQFRKHVQFCEQRQVKQEERRQENLALGLSENAGKHHPCTQCSKIFQRPNYLRIHMETVHLRIRHVCEYCGKDFAYERSRDACVQRHTGVFKYRCEWCDKPFTRSCVFNKHMKRCKAERDKGKEPGDADIPETSKKDTHLPQISTKDVPLSDVGTKDTYLPETVNIDAHLSQVSIKDTEVPEVATNIEQPSETVNYEAYILEGENSGLSTAVESGLLSYMDTSSGQNMFSNI